MTPVLRFTKDAGFSLPPSVSILFNGYIRVSPLENRVSDERQGQVHRSSAVDALVRGIADPADMQPSKFLLT